MISDVVKIEANGEEFTRPVCASTLPARSRALIASIELRTMLTAFHLSDAGNIIARVRSKEPVKIVTIRPTAFDKAVAEGGSAEVEEFAPSEGEGPSLALASARSTLDHRPRP